ncbi:hypothetical protein V865_005827 [Kwoniella europaea PYCC6329]|uniref:F-box domain-containing protein n=1 Tax=Kwoniella europaea PYCC6329 TaxID=1423913 RepID=A0AAX4KQ43_9TREE
MTKRKVQIQLGCPDNFGSPFPVAVLRRIFTHLLCNNRSALATCCRVSRSFSQIASPILYARIGISSIPKRDSTADYSLDRLTVNGREKPTTRKKKLLKCARYVTVDARDFSALCGICRNKKMSFPKLKVLTLCLTIDSTGPIMHKDPIVHSPKRKQQKCSLLKSITPAPKKLVIDGANMTSITAYPLGFPKSVYDNLEEITFICPPIFYLPDPSVGGFPYWSDLPLKRVNWMFFTKDDDHYWTLGRHHLNPNKQKYGSGRFTDEYWSFSNFLLSFPNNIEINIINSGLIHPYTIGSAYFDQQYNQYLFAYQIRQGMLAEVHCRFGKHQPGHIRKNTEENLKTNLDIELAKVQERWNAIRWVGMKEYLRNNDWEGELEPDEVKVWLNSK